MKRIFIKDKEKRYRLFYLNFKNSNILKFRVENVCIIKIYKFHNHRYDLQCFSYINENIFNQDNIRTLKELNNVIQNFIAQNLIV